MNVNYPILRVFGKQKFWHFLVYLGTNKKLGNQTKIILG